jgi:hypothetical protein
VGRGGAPPSESRSWIHPSELPSFDALATRHRVRSRLARLIATFVLLALIAGAAGLASINRSPAPNQPMTANVAKSVSALPAYARATAQRTVELTITTPGHVSHVAAMVLSHDLAVTTTPIAHNALLTGSLPGHVNFPVTWVTRDRALNFTIVKLSHSVASLHFAPMPASASVLALSPIVQGSTDAPRFAWATTTLGDPLLRANNLVSYLATNPDGNLNGFVDAIALDSDGRVVAVLSTGHLWYSALFVARVAEIEALGHGCHGGLGVASTNAQGGGATVTALWARSAAKGVLKVGDVVTRLNGHDIDTGQTLTTWLYLTPAYSKATVTFLRGTTTHRAVVTLACAL